jgi:hypothetical protein
MFSWLFDFTALCRVIPSHIFSIFPITEANEKSIYGSSRNTQKFAYDTVSELFEMTSYI